MNLFNKIVVKLSFGSDVSWACSLGRCATDMDACNGTLDGKGRCEHYCHGRS